MLGSRADDAHHDRLGPSAPIGSVAAPDLPVHDGRADALVGSPVRRVDSLVGQEGEHRWRFSLQVGQELADLFVARFGLAERPQLPGWRTSSAIWALNSGVNDRRARASSLPSSPFWTSFLGLSPTWWMSVKPGQAQSTSPAQGRANGPERSGSEMYARWPWLAPCAVQPTPSPGSPTKASAALSPGPSAPTRHDRYNNQ